MAYHDPGTKVLDYAPCHYGRSKLVFRGPRRRLDIRFVAMIGGTETYGKFVADPYPAQSEELLGAPVVNFGQMNAGIDVFAHDQTVIDAASDAAVTVVQVLGAQNMSNRFYAVHPRRNDRFLRASAMLKTIYRDLDFTAFNFTRHLLSTLREENPEKFALIEAELKKVWVTRMKTLITTIRSPVVLLWLSDHAPGESGGGNPLLVDKDMLAAVTPYAANLVKVVVGPEEITDGFKGLVYSDLEEPAAHGLLGVVAHERAARALHPVLEGFV